MNKYMLILFDNEESFVDFSPEDMQEEIALHGEWIQQLGERFDSGEALNQEAKSIDGAEKIVTDGPYLESKELVGGFYIINSKSLEEATEIAKGCPVLRLGGKVEVREVMKM